MFKFPSLDMTGVWDRLGQGVDELKARFEGMFASGEPAPAPAPPAGLMVTDRPQDEERSSRPWWADEVAQRAPKSWTIDPARAATLGQQLGRRLANTGDWDRRAEAMGLARGDGRTVAPPAAPDGASYARVAEGTPRPNTIGKKGDIRIDAKTSTEGFAGSRWAQDSEGLAPRAERMKRAFPLGEDYARENEKYFNGDFARTRYMDDAERDAHRLGALDGRLTRGGELLDTQQAKATRLKDAEGGTSDAGTNIFVLDHDARRGPNLYAADAIAENEASLASGAREATHHSSFLSGASVHGAGELGAKEGWLKTISNKSGHHLPDESSNLQTVQALEALGVNTDVARVMDHSGVQSWNARAFAASGGNKELLGNQKALFQDISKKRDTRKWKKNFARRQAEREAAKGQAATAPAPAPEEAPAPVAPVAPIAPAPPPRAGRSAYDLDEPTFEEDDDLSSSSSESDEDDLDQDEDEAAAAGPRGVRDRYNQGWRRYLEGDTVRWHVEAANHKLDEPSQLAARSHLTRGGMRLATRADGGSDARIRDWGLTPASFKRAAKYGEEHEDATTFRPRSTGLSPGIHERTRYYDDAERDAHELHADEDGLLRRASGAVMDTTSAAPTSLVGSDAGRNIFALDHDDRRGQRLYAADARAETDVSAAGAEAAKLRGERAVVEHTHHSSFTGGQELDAAGDMRVKEGFVQRLSNSSGHYTPDARGNLQALRALEGMGVNLDTTKVETKVKQGQDAVRDYRALAVLATGNNHALMDAHDATFAGIDALRDDGGVKPRSVPEAMRVRRRALPAAQPRAAATPWYEQELREKGWSRSPAEAPAGVMDHFAD